MKRNRIKYHLDGSAVSVHQALKNYTADVALKWISMETSQLIQNESAYKTHMISFNDAHGYMKKRISYIKGWDLHTLSYQIILNCNDFRGISLDNEDDLVMLLSTIDSYNQRKEKDILNAISDNNLKGILLYVLGLAGEQFNYQVLPKHIDSFAREMFILIDIGIDGVDKTIDDISIGKFGCSWELLLKCLIAACAISLVSPIINIGCELFQACFDIPYNTFLSVLESYTSTYETIRQSADDYGRQILMGKPYVYTQKRELISINVYLNLFLIDHCIYWLIRDYYKNSKIIPIKFGEAFEKYYLKLLKETLNDGEYRVIPREINKKSADWVLSIDQQTFLVEQKSAMLGLKAKQQNPDVDTLLNYYNRNITKAIDQLRQSELDLGYDCIKVILLYDDYAISELITNYIYAGDADVEGGPYWVLTIDEMEMLLYFCKNDREGFNRLIEGKMEYDNKNAPQIRNIESLLNDVGIRENSFLKTESFTKYRKMYKMKYP